MPHISFSSLKIALYKLNYFFAILPTFTVFFQITGPSNKETLHEVPISRAAQLTRGDSVKTALFLEMDISVSLTI